MLRALIEQGADLESTNEDGDSALLLSVWHGREAAVRVLLGQDAVVGDMKGNIVLGARDRSTLNPTPLPKP